MSPVEVAILVAGWAFLLSTPLLRTRRTLAFLGALTVGFVAAGFLGIPGSSIVRIALAWIYLVVFWRFQYWLAGLSRIDEHIDSQLRQAIHKVTIAHRRWVRCFARGDMPATQTAREATARACAAAIGIVDGLAPPSEAWQEAARLFRAYFVALANSATAADREAAESVNGGDGNALVALNKQANTAWQRALRRPGYDPSDSHRAS